VSWSSDLAGNAAWNHELPRRRQRPSLDWFKGKSTGNHGFYHQI
jgi:hypothetical protein